MSKYPIKKEFFPFNLLKPPINSSISAGKMGEMMKPPRWIWKDKDISVKKEIIEGYEGAKIEVLVMEPRHFKTENCLIYYHGGGFVFEAAGYHYRNAKAYILNAHCKVLFVQYRLGPKHPFPIPVEDSYAALKWAYKNAEKLGIHKEKIGVGGDSAGGCLAAAVSMMARDRHLGIKIRFQLLIYPFIDKSLSSESNQRFTDTPMWNSTLSKRVSIGPELDRNDKNYAYASPMDGHFEQLPKAYIETAEFDSLHDDGINYAKKIQDEGIEAIVNETKGTMHGFDIVQWAPTTKEAVASRIEFMRKAF